MKYCSTTTASIANSASCRSGIGSTENVPAPCAT